jgi:hypothetical protein
MSGAFDAFDDDLIAALAADAMARRRAHDVYGPNTEAPDKEDELVLAEWRRRWAQKDSSLHQGQADQDVERDSDPEAER